MKQKSQQLQAEQDIPNDKWTEVLSVEERAAGNDRHYPRKELPSEFDEEVNDTPPSRSEWAKKLDHPPRGRDGPAVGYRNTPKIPRPHGKDPLLP